MALSPRLDLRQSQSLVMTPQLQQAIKLLQLNNLELSAFVEDELERNPLLEREDSESADIERADPLERDYSEAPLLDQAENNTGPEASLDVDVDNLYNNDSVADGIGLDVGDWSGSGGRSDFEDSEFSYENAGSDRVSLRDHLQAQLSMDFADPADRLIALHLIEMLDPAGYLAGDLDELAANLGTDLAHVEQVLGRVQRFEPAGLFARSLSECLALQLREKNRLDPAMQALLDNLGLLAKRDLQGLMRICGIDAEDLTDMIHEIKALDPKPGLQFDFETAQAIIPDVLMRANADGGWQVELNSETLPRVLVNSRYFSTISAKAKREEKSYLNERFQSANWLVKSLHQRATTILKVATEIVRQQDGFFRMGVAHLKPLVLRDIAHVIGMHESTVSRVTSNKYIHTPRGIFELKYFFTQALASKDGGDAHSAEAVRHRIKALIDAEGRDVLSDDRLVDILKSEGVDIARRTVAKYREGMNIPSSVQRRRERALGV